MSCTRYKSLTLGNLSALADPPPQRVQDFQHLFSGLESRAEDFQDLIANVTTSAHGLHEVVDDAAAKIAKMAWFGAIPIELFGVGWLVLAVAVLHWYSPNHAKIVASIMGEFRPPEP